MENNIYNLLFDWQKNIIDKFKNRQNFGLFLDMGLGKTPISLAFAEQNRCEKVIIVTLNAKVYETITTPGSWYQWAAKSNMNWKQFSKTNNIDLYSNDNSILITNYESLFERNIGKKASVILKDYLQKYIATCKGKNVALIIDESHKVKVQRSHQSLAIALMKKLLERDAANFHMYLLSGTPFTTGYIDLYNQLKLLGLEMNKSQFTNEFCIYGNIYGLALWQQPIVGYKNIPELFALLHQYALTIKSKEILDLPEQIFTKHLLPVSSEFKLYTSEKVRGEDINAELTFRKQPTITEYEVHKKKHNPFYRNIAYPDIKWFADTAGNFWLRARQLSIGFQGNATEAMWFDKSRMEAIKKFLIENKDNYIIFYNFTPELVELYQICTELGYNIDLYSGEIKSLTNYETYSNNLNKGIVKEGNNVIIANFASGSSGMNWQNYSHCIITSLPLYKDYAQALKRIHRIGQKETVFYHLFLQDNWLDKGMMAALDGCTNYSEEMFDADISRIQEINFDEHDDD